MHTLAHVLRGGPILRGAAVYDVHLDWMRRSNRSIGVRVDDRVCESCHKPVSSTDVACRHCGQRFQVTVRRPGTLFNDFFRLCLGVCALSLPIYCFWVGLTAPRGLGDIAAYVASQAFFIPWLTGMISAATLVWLTEERSR